MNTECSWIHRVPGIIDRLSSMSEPYLDRSACQILFGLQRSAMVDLLGRLGAEQLGRSLVIGRPVLLERLQKLMESPEWSWREERRRRVAEIVGQHRVMIRPRKKLEGLAVDELPGVTLSSGALTIEHAGPQDLLQKLYGLARAIAADPDRFEARVGSVPSYSGKTMTAGG